MSDLNLLLQTALAQHQQGQVDAAIKQYRHIVAQDATYQDAWHLLGIALCQIEVYDHAEEAILKAIALDDRAPTFYNSAGNLYKAQNDYDKAKSYYQKALEIEPNNPAVLNNLAVIAMHEDDLTTAKSCLDRALKLKSNYSDAYFNLALVAAREDNFDLAERYFLACISYDPTFASAFDQLGQIKQQGHQLKEAQSYYEQAHELLPDHPDILHRLASVGALLGDANSETLYQRVLAIDPNHLETLHNLASLHYERKSLDSALQYWLKCVEIEPSATLFYNIACVYFDKTYHKEALIYFEKSCQMDPRPVAALNNIATIHLKEHNHEAALAAYTSLLELDPNHATARHLNAALCAQSPPPATPPQQYIVDLFDHYADHYESHLTEHLNYRGHIEVCDVLCQWMADHSRQRLTTIVDLGCGSGLCGPLLKPMTDTLIGVDLSPKMLAYAQQKGVYDALYTQDCCAALDAYQDSIDAIVMADVLPYLGDCQMLIERIARALTPDGVWVVSFETADQFGLTANGRYVHALPSLQAIATRHGLKMLDQQSTTLRNEHDQPVASTIVIWTLTA